MYFTSIDSVHVTAWYDPDIDGMEVIKVKLEVKQERTDPDWCVVHSKCMTNIILKVERWTIDIDKKDNSDEKTLDILRSVVLELREGDIGEESYQAFTEIKILEKLLMKMQIVFV